MRAPSIRVQTSDTELARNRRLLSALRGVQVTLTVAGALLAGAELAVALGGR